LDLATAKSKVPITKMREISPRIAEAYAGKDSKTITRDVDILAKMGLVSRA
jgi:hypothetical protein